ncbi:type IV secretion system DNA-binding domain-containing protein [Acidiferrobacter sp. SPIII_3]|uniref:type IV secretion system DNA-binding domain-containing protein n=1 Tax=Acidiferrobacter sp. SPIII_3 TaxID=1281578 RepID=UPI00143DCDE6|nr:type IV secretion system DNA-binding domain-containing protein [Acidiferrobacter sp. SPIII_3]
MGVEMVAYHYGQSFQPPLALFHLILRWGLVPAPWGWRRFVPTVVAALFGASAGGAVWRLLTIPSERHIRGFILHKDPHAIAMALKPGKAEAPGVLIHPEVPISQSLETRHTLLVGGSGGGKTTVLWPLIQQAQARGDKILLFDSKGDFTEKLGGRFTLLSPTDSRSARWALGNDILTNLDAHSLTETLIPSAPGGDKEPMWVNGARALLLGVITDVQHNNGQGWGFVTLAAAIARALADFDTLKNIIAREDPAMLSLLGGEDAAAPSRTTMGFLVQVATSVRHVINLGVAAADLAHSKNPGWAVRAWLAGKTPPVAVVGFRDSARSLSQAWAASLIEQVVRQVGDMPDASPADRRIWLIVDEAPRSGKIPSITDALTTARSKGLRAILGIQSLAQIREVYTRETATTWAGQTASKIICQTTAPEDQKWCSDLLGEREVERYSHQISQNYHNDSGAQHSGSWQRVREPVLLPASFGQELRVLPTGPRALLMSGGEAALLDWPFPQLQKHRPAYVQARWTQPGYQRPVWGKAPPDVAAPPTTTTDRPDEKKAKRRDPVPAPQAPAPIPSGDLPDFPTAPAAQESAGDDLTKEAAAHTLDAVVPGASLAARILETAARAAGQAPPAAAQQSSPMIPNQGQEPEDERGGEDDE